MRRRDIPTNPEPASRKRIADFFGLEIAAVGSMPQADTYVINISGNKEAQEQFKVCAPFGNGKYPRSYNFTDDILVWWNGNKIQPV